MFAVYASDPPANFSRVTLPQLISADKVAQHQPASGQRRRHARESATGQLLHHQRSPHVCFLQTGGTLIPVLQSGAWKKRGALTHDTKWRRVGATTINSIDNHGSDEKHAEGHGDDFIPMDLPGTTDRRKQLFENMLVLKILAGSSNLTVEVRKAHLKGVAVDKTIGRAKGPITVLDLTLEKDVEFLAEFIRQEAENIRVIHCAPPCGTCSAARKRRLSPAFLDKLANEGITPPQVLRSDAFSMGLPNLRRLDAMKAHSANQLYWATSKLVKLALSPQLRVLIENPTNSLFWKTEPMLDLLEHCPGRMNLCS